MLWHSERKCGTLIDFGSAKDSQTPLVLHFLSVPPGCSERASARASFARVSGFAEKRLQALRESLDGTRGYIPPEGYNSAAGDMWSAGILLNKLVPPLS